MNTKVWWGNEIERLHIIKGIVGDAEKSLLFSLHETPKRRGKTEEWKIEYIIDCDTVSLNGLQVGDGFWDGI